jgi:CxxC motif-containing protein (DUF1111 family)
MKNSRTWIAVTCLCALFGSRARADFGDPLSGLSAAETTQFSGGRDAFNRTETVADGLGPVFNESACVTCHIGPSAAVGGNTARVETRFGTTTGGVFDPLAAFGGSLRQDHGIGSGDGTIAFPSGCAGVSFAAEVVPPSATIIAGRRTTPLFGLGLVEAVPDSVLQQLAQSEANQSPSTAGIVSLVTDADTGTPGHVGRFGWKAQVATLHVFAGDAYLNEMGITNPSFPNESCPQGNCAALSCNPVPALNDDGDDVTNFANFMRLLAPPPRGSLVADDKEGENRFDKIGCTNCHTPQLHSGPSPVAALANKTFAPYSDFLLHDMGTLGDGIAQNTATGRLMRTAPLWGVRVQSTLLHDGRATTLTAAILAHDGQAAASRDQFNGLNQTQKNKVLAFLASL